MATRHKVPLPEPRHRGALQRFGFLLVPNFSLIALSSAVDPLRLANMALGHQGSSRIVEVDRDRLTCSGGVSPLELMTLASFFVFGIWGTGGTLRRKDRVVSNTRRTVRARGPVRENALDTTSCF